MQKRSLIIPATLIAALVLALAVIALAADPFVGTWRMNAAKSKFSSPPPKSYAMKIEAQEKNGSQKIVIDEVDADGKATHRAFAQKYDGKDYPETGDQYADMTSATKADSNTVDYLFKKNGKEVFRGRAVISKDGKTQTDTGSGKDAKGQAITYTIVMEKQ